MKLPWTPGPWQLGGTDKSRKIGKASDGDVYFVSNWYCGTITDEQMKNTVILASKAPEMAELLIELIESKYVAISDGLRFKIGDLLKEIGYQEDE